MRLTPIVSKPRPEPPDPPYSLVGLGVLLTLVDVMLFPGMVGQQTAAGTRTGADDRTLGSTNQTTDDGAAHGGTADDLRLGVVAGVMVMLLTFRLVVRLLAERVQGRQCHRK